MENVNFFSRMDFKKHLKKLLKEFILALRNLFFALRNLLCFEKKKIEEFEKIFKLVFLDVI